MTRSGVAFQGLCFRHSRARYATVDQETLEASMRVGGRFNPPGEFGAVYVALDRETALRELERRISLSGLPREHFLPRVIVQVRARLSRVLDLTDPRVRAQLELSVADIVAEDWTRCQQVGRKAREAGYSGIRFPSATGEGQNLVIFLEKLEADERLEVEEIEEVIFDR